MCTAISYKTNQHYFGRNLDAEFSYPETITITPRNFPLTFKHMPQIKEHYAMIGVAYVASNYPLYFDATNEKGLSMAGLLFSGNAHYQEVVETMDNITPYEFITWILGQCATINEAVPLLARCNLINIPFSDNLPLSPLHWMLSDATHSIVIEPLKDGLKFYDNPVGVLTNNPTFDYHLMHLNDYMKLTKKTPCNTFSELVPLEPYSRGLGTMGLPGDLSSSSRFIKCTFTKLNSVNSMSETGNVNQFFHILGSVEQQRGCVELKESLYEITIYSSCCNTQKGIYYYKTYENSQITAVDMHKEELESQELILYPMLKDTQIKAQN